MSSMSSLIGVTVSYESTSSTSTFDRKTTSSSSTPSSCNSSSSSSLPFPVDSFDGDEIAIAVFKAIPMVIVMAAAVGGNLLVIVAVIRNDRLRLLANTFLVSLAVADLLVALLVMPFSATMELAGRWPFHPIVCDLFNANDVMFSTASLLHLGCVSVDRYVAITDPFGYDRRMTRRRVAVMLGFLWTISAALAHLPIHLGWYERKPEVKTADTTTSSSSSSAATTMSVMNSTIDTSSCVDVDATYRTVEECKFEVNRVYGVVSCAISFWLPVIIMVFAYQRIYHAAQRQAKFIHAQSLSAGSSTDRLDYSTATGNGKISVVAAIPIVGVDRPSTGATQNHHQQQRQERRKMRREHKAAKTLGVILGAFLCCWLPFFIFYLTVSLCGDYCDPPPILVSILFWIGYLNSALNPVIYAAFNRDFRHSFRRTLKSCLPTFSSLRCCGDDGNTIGGNSGGSGAGIDDGSASEGPFAVLSSCCRSFRDCCNYVRRCFGCTRCCTPSGGNAKNYGDRTWVPHEANCLRGDDVAPATDANRCSFSGVPGRRMIQSITEETSLR